MKEQIPQPATLSRTLQGKTREANTASVTHVLQAYKKDISQRQEIEDDELLQGKFETAQRDELEDDELLQGKFEVAQRDELEDDELLQGKFETAQRDELEDDELLQGKFETTQRDELEDDELLQGKFETAQREELEDDELLQGKFETAQRQEAPNNTGLPDNLKAGVEQLSGLDMSDVKVHYNSSKPASVQAYAYTQGTDIHVAPGQEKHLGHEAWHVAQQKQGRVQPTTSVGGMAVNDNAGLESEADVMGGKAVQIKTDQISNDNLTSTSTITKGPIQRMTGMEVELNIPFYEVPTGKNIKFFPNKELTLNDKDREFMAAFLFGGLTYGKSYGEIDKKYDITADHGEYHTAHCDFKNILVKEGFVSNCSYINMSNLEYRTKPLEERDDKSQNKMTEIASEIQNHVAASTKMATSGISINLPEPVNNKLTGLPVSAFEKLVNGNINAEKALEDVKTAIKPTVYYQTTTGVLPSEIPELFKKAAEDIENESHSETSKANICKEILKMSVEIANEVTKDAKFLKDFSKGRLESLNGWLTLVSQYLMAYSVETSSYVYQVHDGRLTKDDSTVKNMVAYLSKTPIYDTLCALPDQVRPNENNKENWEALFKALKEESEKDKYNIVNKLGLTDYFDKEYYNNKGSYIGIVKHGAVFGGKTPGEWLNETLNGNNPFHLITGNILTLDNGQDTLTPKLSINDEQAIPLEDRKVMSKHSFEDVRNVELVRVNLLNEWDSAKNRRSESTKIRTNFDFNYKTVNANINQIDKSADSIYIYMWIQNEFKKVNQDPVDAIAETDKLSNIQDTIRTKLDRVFQKRIEETKYQINQFQEWALHSDDVEYAKNCDSKLKMIIENHCTKENNRIKCILECYTLAKNISKQIDEACQHSYILVCKKSKNVKKWPNQELYTTLKGEYDSIKQEKASLDVLKKWHDLNFKLDQI